ncbi:YktB family protein [Camelliibacillus cellulosilyticus]|uniref:UPF0637 protein ACFO4N_00520 n=1 Tax=Camelliibacillus cellulosilyticus TaxID=2174486 RepID=A0ABV9GJ00_9BACL
MTFNGFTEQDFAVFNVKGLEARMEAIITTIRPKLEALADQFAPILTAFTGDEMFPHVAKHARRTVNPPNDTWVAFASDKRGYKKHPHFQAGLWKSHVFIWFAIINEAVNKDMMAARLKDHIDDIRQTIPSSYVWSIDHTKPDTIDTLESAMLDRLEKVKKAELLCGVTMPKPVAISRGKHIADDIEQTFKKLSALYEWAVRDVAKQP